MSRPTTISEALFATAERSAGEYVFHLEEGIVTLSCAELAERAQRGARHLSALGVEPGDAVGLLGPNRPEWIVWAFATWIAGAVLVPVQIPLRVRDPDAFREQLRTLVDAADCRRVLADPLLSALLPDEVAVAWDQELDGAGESFVAPQPKDPAVIQFTSGSTASPKGAVLAHSAVLAQMDLLHRGYHHDDGQPRSILSWTPFFHDLGLFASVVLPAVWGSVSHQLPTECFARDPAEWLRLVSLTRAALTVGPSSAFGSAVRAATRRSEAIDLSSLEVAFFAAEGADPEVAQRIAEQAQSFSFPLEALGSSYGLAEAVMAAAYTSVGSGLHIDHVSLDGLAADGVAMPADSGAARPMISCGPPRMELRIGGPAGELPERHVGEILLRGGSIASHYVGADPPDPFRDGWLCTGDLGYLADGELYVAGRKKDIVIASGHNYYPEDFEWAAARVDGVRPGRCVAFSRPGTEGIVVLVEAEENGSAGSLARAVRRSILDAVGVAPSDVVVLPSGVVEKTTSGKLRRAAMRDAYANGALSAASA